MKTVENVVNVYPYVDLVSRLSFASALYKDNTSLENVNEGSAEQYDENTSLLTMSDIILLCELSGLETTDRSKHGLA